MQKQINKILESHFLTWAEIISQRRQANLVECRREIVRFLRKQGLSYPAIGEMMNRDHTSIMHLASDARREKQNAAAKKRHRERRMKEIGFCPVNLNAGTGELNMGR